MLFPHWIDVGLVWGIILITTPACTNFAGVATNRFLLGTFEAVVNPGFVLIMGRTSRRWLADLTLMIFNRHVVDCR